MNGWIAAAALVFAAVGGGAQAAPTALPWSTYLRTGPSDHAPIVDEINKGEIVDVGPCRDRWCAVLGGSGQGVGYIDQDALTLPQVPPATAKVGGPEGCFWAGEASWRALSPTRFCQTEPAK